jgi:hypothetical protein
MFKEIKLARLRHDPKIGYYFRYPLHHGDFHELRSNGRLVGRVAAKPLYGKLTPEGRVDRSKGFNGQIAIVFIPARVRSTRTAQLVLTRMPKDKVTTPEGKRNWKAIQPVAGRAVLKRLAARGL